MTGEIGRRLVAVALAVLMVGSAAVAGVGAQTGGSGPADGPDAADEIYVTDDGEAVVVYDGETGDDSPSQVEYGVSVPESVLYALVTDPVDGTPDVRGNVTATLNDTGFAGEGALSAPAPDALTAFEMDLASTVNDEVSEANGSLSATVEDGGGVAQLLRSAETSGSVTSSASSFQADGEFQADLAVPLGEELHQSYALSEDDGTYTLAVEQSRQVRGAAADTWDTREEAVETIRAQYAGLAEELGGSATVTVEEYAFEETDRGGSLDIAYTVTYENVEDGIERAVRASLAEDPTVNESQAETVASEVSDVQIDRAAIEYGIEGASVSGSIDVDVQNFDGLAAAYTDIAAGMAPPGATAGAFQQSQAQLEAQQAANLTQTFTWSGSLSHPDDESTALNLSFEQDTENWGAYVDELDERNVSIPATSYEFTGGLSDGRIHVAGSLTQSGESVFQGMAQGMQSGGEMPGEMNQLAVALAQADFQGARLDASYDGDGLRVETAASFENLSAVRDAFATETGLPAFDEIVGEYENGTGATYLRVPDAVDAGDVTEDDVRALSYVDADTEVHLPGEWDREFPTVDVERAEEFLNDTAAGSSASGPGFGPVVAVLALVSAALLAVRRD